MFKSSIAVPILELDETEPIIIDALNNTGYYYFVIKNYNETNVSDVSFKYNIEIVSDTDETIAFELYQDDQQITLNNKRTDEIYIKGVEKAEYNYKLKIFYDKSKNNLQEDIIKNVKINLHSEQIKG